MRSGSFVVEGTASFEVEAVGAESYAERIAGTAREFRHPRSPLERSIDRLLYVLLAVMVPLGAMLIVALRKQDVGIHHAVDTAVAGMVTLIPEGLILLVSVTYAAAALRMARAGALSQQLNAIESLASVDTICVDKTGTLTTASLRLVELLPAVGTTRGGAGRRPWALRGRIGGAKPDAEAVAEALPAPRRRSPPTRSSRSSPGGAGAGRGSGARATSSVRRSSFRSASSRRAARAEQEAGRRVVAFGLATAAFPQDIDAGPPPLQPLGLAVLAEEMRGETRETIAYLLEQGVAVVVLSGDAAATVGAIAADAGVPMVGPPVEGASLPDDDLELDRISASLGVVGRISPEGKRRVVASLRRNGRYVAMVGDGVNDVPALKASRLSIAQGSGTQMAKAVSDIVLVNGDFATIPAMVGEGRRILRNIQRVTKLFVTKSVFAAFVIVAVGITPVDYPLLPRHLTLVGAITVGIPAFFLALAPSEGPWRTDDFLRDVGRFAVPAGVAAGLGVTTSYLIAVNVFDLGLMQSRTAATSTLVVIGLYLVLALESTSTLRARLVAILCGSLLAVYVVVLLLPGTRRFFALAIPNSGSLLLIILGSAIAIGFLWLTDDRFIPLRSKSA